MGSTDDEDTESSASVEARGETGPGGAGDPARRAALAEVEAAGEKGVAMTQLAGWGLAGAIAVLGVVAVAAALAGARWLDGRTFMVVGLVTAAPVALWWGFAPWSGPADDVSGAGRRWALGATVAALAAAVAVVIVWTDLGQADLDRLAGDSDGPRLGDRFVGRDVAPAAVYLAGLTAGVLATACAAFAVACTISGRGHRRDCGESRRRAVLAGGLVGVLLTPGVLVVARDRQAQADDRADAATIAHTVTGQATRFDGEPDPVLPAAEAWRIDSLPFSAPLDGSTRRVVAVPGWDVLLVVGGEQRHAEDAQNGLVAVSATEGAELWRYESRAGFGPVTVDPDTGRVLVVGWDAAVVLRLENGSEVTRRRLTDGLSACEHQLDATRGSEPRMTVAPIAALMCGSEDPSVDTLALVEVATAELVPTPEPERDSTGCGSSIYGVATSGEPVIVHRTADNPSCPRSEPPTGEGHRDRYAPLQVSIQPPDDLPISDEGAQARLEVARMFDVGDLTVLALAWHVVDGPNVVQHDLVAVDSTGAIRWRTSRPPVAAHESRLTPQTRFLPVTATDAGVVVAWDGDWHLLSLRDGTEQLRVPGLPDEFTNPAAGEQLIYTFPEDGGLVVRSATTLSLLQTWEGFDTTLGDLNLPGGQAIVAAGRLVVYEPGDGTLTGYADGPPRGRHAEDSGTAVYDQVDDLCSELDLSALDPLAGPVVYGGPRDPVADERGCYLEREGRRTPTGEPFTESYDSYYVDATTQIPEPGTPQASFRIPSPGSEGGEVVREIEDIATPVWRAQIRTRVGPASGHHDEPDRHELDATLFVQDGNLLLTLRLVGTVHGTPRTLHRQYDDLLLAMGRATISNLRR